MEPETEIESILYIAREVSVYKVPPLKTNVGYRAGEWGDLAQPLWKGRLRIIERSSGIALQFEDSQTGDLFAKADYDPERPSVEAVLDSSRYFVVRVEDAGRKAYIGMGFAERSDSFDFNVALQDFTKRYKAKNSSQSIESESSSHIPAGPKKDYSLKDGQTFTINLPGRSTKMNLSNTSSSLISDSSSATSVPLLPPPPSAGKRK